jgi:phage terminase large subunit GpA-like protein
VAGPADKVHRDHGALCAACGATDRLQVHHRSYERFTQEHDDDLRVLCVKCHGFVHHLERTSAVTLARATDLVIEATSRRAGRPHARKPELPAGKQGSSIDAFFRAERETRRLRSA